LINQKPSDEFFWFTPSYKNKKKLKPWHPQERTLVRRVYPFGYPFHDEQEGIYIEDAKTRKFFGMASREFIIPAEKEEA
jgi:hypothetical protein